MDLELRGPKAPCQHFARHDGKRDLGRSLREVCSDKCACLIQQESGTSVKDFYTQFEGYLDELSELQPLPECTCGVSKALVKREE